MAKDDQEEAFDKVLVANLQRAIDFLKYAEAKNGALLTLASAWALAIMALLMREKPVPDDYRIVLMVMLPFIFGAVLVAIWSFAPRTNLRRFLGGRPTTPGERNLLFFGHLASHSPAAAEKELRERYYPTEGHVATEAYTRDLCIQLTVNSQIVRRKLRFFYGGILLLALGIAVPLIWFACQHLGVVLIWR